MPNRNKPEVIIFDVNETLLDLNAMRSSVGAALGGRGDLLPIWFSTMLHYSLVDTLTDNYRDFLEVGAGALVMVAKREGIDLSLENAKRSIVGPITSLPPHSDVKVGLKSLKNRGFRLASLTNSSKMGLAKQFENAGLSSYFSRQLSVENVRAFKPALVTYKWALSELDVKPANALMVAAHAWDLAGAKAAGLQTAFIKRDGATLYPNVGELDYIANDIIDLNAKLCMKLGE